MRSKTLLFDLASNKIKSREINNDYNDVNNNNITEQNESDEDIVKVLVLTHGDSSKSIFWKEFENRLLKNQETTNFNYEIKLINDTIEHENFILNDLILNEKYKDYSYVASTVRTTGISQKLDWLSNYVKMITFNTYVDVDENGRKGERGITHVGNTPKTEQQLGITLALSLAKDVLNTVTLTEHSHYNIEELQNQVNATSVKTSNNMNCPPVGAVGPASVASIKKRRANTGYLTDLSSIFDDIDLSVLTFEDFKKDLDKNNCTCLCYTDEPENSAIIKRYEGVSSVFNDAKLAGSKEELSELINDPEATYTLIALNDSCKDCVLDIANDKLKDGINIINIGVNDVTSVNRDEIKLNTVPKFDAVGGSCPECQADALNSSINGDHIKSRFIPPEWKEDLDNARAAHTDSKPSQKSVKKKCFDNIIADVTQKENLNRHLTLDCIKEDNPALLRKLNKYFKDDVQFLNKTLQWYRFFGESDNEWAYTARLPEKNEEGYEEISKKISEIINTRTSGEVKESIGPMDLLDSSYSVKNGLDEGFKLDESAIQNIIGNPQSDNKLVRNEKKTFTFQQTYDFMKLLDGGGLPDSGLEKYKNHDLVVQVLNYLNTEAIPKLALIRKIRESYSENVTEDVDNTEIKKRIPKLKIRWR